MAVELRIQNKYAGTRDRVNSVLLYPLKYLFIVVWIKE